MKWCQGTWIILHSSRETILAYSVYIPAVAFIVSRHQVAKSLSIKAVDFGYHYIVTLISWICFKNFT